MPHKLAPFTALTTLLTLALLSSLVSGAGAEPLETDRPSQALTPKTVGSGRVQVETGVVYQHFHDGADQTSVSTVLRVGLSEHSEIRVESGPLNYQSSGASTNTAIAYKQQLGDDPDFSVLVGLQVPIGHLQGKHSLEPEVVVLGGFDLTDHLEADLNLGASLPMDEMTGHRFGQFFGAFDLQYEFTDGWKLYGELFGTTPVGLGEKGVLGMDGGFMVQLNDNWQVDFGAIRGLSPQTLDWGATAGVSARF